MHRAYVHHLALRTTDIPALEQFYTNVLGLSVSSLSPNPDPTGHRGSVWLDAGGTILMIEQRGPMEPPIDRASMELTCFTIVPREAPAIVSRLAAANTSVEAKTAYSIYFRDPDGRRVGVSSYPDELALSA